MKIRIDDITEGGMEVSSDSTVNGWLKAAFADTLGDEKFKEGDGGRLNLQLFRDKRNVTIIGGIILKYHPSCDRCLTVFQKSQQITIHQTMMPAKEKDVEEENDDESVTFYTGNELELDPLVREQILLSQEMVNICNDDCKGLCQTCGKNLNNGHCGCKKKVKKASPFKVLKKIVS